jgi:hypothetical protein
MKTPKKMQIPAHVLPDCKSGRAGSWVLENECCGKNPLPAFPMKDRDRLPKVGESPDAQADIGATWRCNSPAGAIGILHLT